MDCVVYYVPPIDFTPQIHVAGCFCECEDRILLLKRNPEKPYGNSWGIPAGKIESQENEKDAVIREVREEVGLEMNRLTLRELGCLYCRLPEFDYLFHIFYESFETLPQIQLEPLEHLEARWVTFNEALSLPLIVGGKEALYFYKENK